MENKANVKVLDGLELTMTAINDIEELSADVERLATMLILAGNGFDSCSVQSKPKDEIRLFGMPYHFPPEMVGDSLRAIANAMYNIHLNIDSALEHVKDHVKKG